MILKYPLFGEDSSPSYTSRFLSLIITAVFCLIFLLCTIFVRPFNKKTKYKEVQIVLNDAPKIEKKTEQAATAAPAPAAPSQTEAVQEEVSAPVEEIKSEPASAPVEKIVESPEPVEKPVQKPVETPKPVAKPKQETKPVSKPKTETKTVPDPAPVPQKIYEDPMEAFNKQTSAQPKKDFDWSQFDDDVTTSESAVQSKKSVENTPVQSSFSGSAGITDSTKTQTSQSSTETAKTPSKNSDGTNKALKEIADAQGTVNADTSGISQKTSQTGKSASENDSIKWSGGAARKLIKPKEPAIKFSDASQNLLGSYTEINIIFEVQPSGYVVRNTINTSPAVPQSVLNEIADQISEWWFDEGSSTATATLLCKIKRN